MAWSAAAPDEVIQTMRRNPALFTCGSTTRLLLIFSPFDFYGGKFPLYLFMKPARLVLQEQSAPAARAAGGLGCSASRIGGAGGAASSQGPAGRKGSRGAVPAEGDRPFC